VQEIYPALHRGAIWIAGGFASNGGATDRVIAFDVAKQAWSEQPALPKPSHHVHLAVLGDKLFAIGGFLGGESRSQWICTARVLVLDGDRWADGPTLPRPIGEAVPLVHDGRIHLIGGRAPRADTNAAWNDHVDVDDHWVLASGDTGWKRAAPLPVARNSAGGAVLGGALHVISGRTVGDPPTAAHHLYDPGADTWREGEPFPEPRGGLAAATWRGRIVAGGGEVFKPPSVGASLYELDPAGAWRRIDTLPTPRHGHGFVAADDALYVVGGAREPSASGTLARVDVIR
jgi:N-acetylneuraminic acid mutarotase